MMTNHSSWKPVLESLRQLSPGDRSKVAERSFVLQLLASSLAMASVLGRSLKMANNKVCGGGDRRSEL